MSFNPQPLIIFLTAAAIAYIIGGIIKNKMNKRKNDEYSHVYGKKVKGKFE